MAKRSTDDTDSVVFGRTPLGQLVYDLGFTKLSDRYLARKYRLGIARVRDYRAAFKRGFKQGKAQSKGMLIMITMSVNLNGDGALAGVRIHQEASANRGHPA